MRRDINQEFKSTIASAVEADIERLALSEAEGIGPLPFCPDAKYGFSGGDNSRAERSSEQVLTPGVRTFDSSTTPAEVEMQEWVTRQLAANAQTTTSVARYRGLHPHEQRTNGDD